MKFSHNILHTYSFILSIMKYNWKIRRFWVADPHKYRLTHFLPMFTFVTVLLKFGFKKKGIMEKISYERRAYESVDVKSLS